MTMKWWLDDRWRLCVMQIIMGAFLCLVIVATTGSAVGAEPKIVIIEFHGMKKGILDESLEGLPHFQELIKGSRNDHAYIYIPDVLTTIPAASVPAIASMYTGRYPQRTGVVSTIWFNRRTHKVRTMISYFQQRINRILGKRGVETLFDYTKKTGRQSMTSMLMVTKGADWSLKSGAFFWGNASVLGFIHKGIWIPDSKYVDEKTVSAFLTGHVLSYNKSLAGVLEKHHRIPDVMVIQLLGIDLFSHYPPRDLKERNASMNEIQRYYTQKVLDPLIGRLIQALKKAGCYKNTIFFLISEHGFTKIEKHISDKLVDRSLRGEFKLPYGETTNSQAEAVIMPGACTKEIYLKNRLTGKWMDPPRLLADVKPAVDRVLDNPGIREPLNALVIRQYPGERNEGTAEHGLWWLFDWGIYMNSERDNDDFLRALRPLNELPDQFVLKEHVIRGLEYQYTSETAPDIKLINKKGCYYECDLDKYAHHGSYYPDDSIVSFWVAGPGLLSIISGRHVVTETASTLDLVPMVTFLLGMPVPEGLDGTNPLQDIQHRNAKF
ncbi:MAG: alkaline phosphatase family protein [Deltaproteobacteria bacterium]|nr:alkaline phosphatase family protein [Deltaproteobacteria bacterium]